MTDQPLIACLRDNTAKYLLAPVVIPGDMLVTASAGIPQNQVSWVVNLQLNPAGTGIFNTVSTALTQKSPPQNQFAIVLDSEVVSAPRINEVIPNGQAMISGNFTQSTATDLANVLKYGALPLAFDLSEVSNVSPTLGGEQLTAGLIAGAIGLALVILYALFYYRGWPSWWLGRWSWPRCSPTSSWCCSARAWGSR